MATTTERALAELVARRAGDLVVAKNLVAEAKQEEARLGKQAEVASRAADEWGQRAMSAVRAGDDVIARDALVRRREYERQAGGVRAAIVAEGAGGLRLAGACAGASTSGRRRSFARLSSRSGPRSFASRSRSPIRAFISRRSSKGRTGFFCERSGREPKRRSTPWSTSRTRHPCSTSSLVSKP